MAPLRPPEVMREVHVHTLNPEIQGSTVCASQPSTMHTFFQVNSTIEKVLGELTETVCVSDLTRRKSRRFIYGTERSLSVSWIGVDLENTAQPKYLGGTFDLTLSYKQHIQNTKMNVATRNNILKKLSR